MFEKESGEIKRERGEMDGSEERGKKRKRSTLFSVFSGRTKPGYT